MGEQRKRNTNGTLAEASLFVDDPDGIYATYNLHADRLGLYAGYELSLELARHLYWEEVFRKKGERIGTYENASGILGILYFHFTNREEAETYLYDMPRHLQVHVVSVKQAQSDADLRADIVRLGEYMTPPFSERSLCGQKNLSTEEGNTVESGWNTEVYAEKLSCLANLVTAENEKGDYGFISLFVVIPEYRRCRVAEALGEEIHRLAGEKNIPCIRGEIRKENMACRRLAEMLGYGEHPGNREGAVEARKNILSECRKR